MGPAGEEYCALDGTAPGPGSCAGAAEAAAGPTGAGGAGASGCSAAVAVCTTGAAAGVAPDDGAGLSHFAAEAESAATADAPMPLSGPRKRFSEGAQPHSEANANMYALGRGKGGAGSRR